jgi:hypothetical protein
MSKTPSGTWIKFKDQEPPLYVDLLVDSDEGLLVAQYKGDNEWTEGGIAWVYYWMLAPKAPEFPVRESAAHNTVKAPRELAKIYADEECSGHAVYGEGLYAGFLAGYNEGYKDAWEKKNE